MKPVILRSHKWHLFAHASPNTPIVQSFIQGLLYRVQVKRRVFEKKSICETSNQMSACRQ